MPKRVDWHYHRKHCDACAAAAAELAKLGVTAATTADARTQRYDAASVAQLARSVTKLITIRRGVAATVKVTAKSPSDAELAELMLGPTGNLRAPTIRVGKTLVVGFDAKFWNNMLE